MRRTAILRGPLEFEDYLVLAAIVLLPWAFGGIELWAFRGAALLVALAAGRALWLRGFSGLGLGAGQARWLLPALLLGLWAAFQLLPLPAGAIRLLSPAAHEIYAQTFPGYGGARPGPSEPLAAVEQNALALVDPPQMRPDQPYWTVLQLDGPDWRGDWRTLSLYPSRTLELSLWFSILLLGFLLVRTRVADPAVARAYRSILFVNFVVLAAFALIQWKTWNGKLFWIREVSSGTRPFGPYVNPIHFSGLMELAVPWLAGYAWSRNLQRRGDRNLSRTLLSGAGALVCLAAALAAASKMGAVLLTLSLAGLIVVGLANQRRRLTFLATAMVLGALTAAMVAQTDLGTRFRDHLERSGGGTQLLGHRWVAWTASTRLLADYPIAGGGFGTYDELFQLYRPAGDNRRIAFTHNDYLQVLLEGGLVAGALLLWLTLAFGKRVWRRLHADRPPSLQRLGLALGVGSLAVHALFDFNHQIPANALLFVACAALIVPSKRRPAQAGAGRRWPRGLAVSLLLLFAWRAAQGIPAGIAWAQGVDHERNGRRWDALEAFERAEVGANRFPALQRAAGLRLAIWSVQAREDGSRLANDRLLLEAAEDYFRAIDLVPVSSDPWAGLSRVYERLESARSGAGEAAPPGAAGRIALGLLERAITLAPMWYQNHERKALLLADYGLRDAAARAMSVAAIASPLFSTHPIAEDPDFPDDLKRAFAEGSRGALGRAPFLTERAHLVDLAKIERQLGRLEVARQDLERARALRGNLQDRAEIDFQIGLIAMTQQDPAGAEQAFQRAALHPVFRSTAQRHLALLASAAGRHEEALDLLTLAHRADPDHPTYALELAQAARQLQRWPLGIRALESLLREDPVSEEGYRALAALYEESGQAELAEKVRREARRHLRSTPPLEAPDSLLED